MSDSNSLSLTTLRTTSAQIAFTLALSMYFTLYSEEGFDLKDFYTDDKPDFKKIGLFSSRLRLILRYILSPNSQRKISSSNNETSESNDIPPSLWQSISQGKLKYFNQEHQLCLSDAGAEEVRDLLDSLNQSSTAQSHINTHQDVHVMNQMLYGKAAPLSARNIAIKASAYTALNALLSLMIITGEEQCMVGFLEDEKDEAAMEDASLIEFNLIFSTLFVANSLQESRQKRSYALSKAYTLCCVNALNQIKKEQDQETDEKVILSPSPTPSNSDNTTDESMSNDGFQDEGDENKPFLSENKNLVTSEVPKATLPRITEKHYKKVYKDGNILSFKGAISSEASKQRSYFTLAAAIVFSLGFLILDIATCAVSLAVRLGIGLGAVAVGSGVRYYSKIEQNKTNLFAKEHRPWLTDIFQTELMSELRVYGLQPVDTTKKISSDTVGVERQVSVDARKFLRGNDNHIQNKTNLKDIETYIKNNLPKDYKQHNRYFVAECLLQIRETQFNEDHYLIQAERENLFSQPTAEFFAREQAKGITHLHQRIMMYISKTNKNNPEEDWNTKYLCKDLKENRLSLNSPTIEQTQEKIKADLAWNPWIFAWRLCSSPPAESDSEKHLKRELSWTMGYMYYTFFTYSELWPWHNSEKALDAYYTKRYSGAEKKLTLSMNKNTDTDIALGGATIFEKFLQKDEQPSVSSTETAKDEVNNTNVATSTPALPTLRKKTLKEQHRDNNAGVLGASFISPLATVALYASYPALGIFADLYGDLLCKAVQAGTCFIASCFFKTLAINHRRNEKQEARRQYQLAN